MAIGEEADMADAVEAVGHGMLQEAADELVRGERHDLGPAVLAIVLPGKADLTIIELHQAAVGDGDAVGVAAEIAEHLLRPGERRLGVDDPLDPGQGIELGGEAGRLGQGGEHTGKAEFAPGVGGAQLLQKPGGQAIQRAWSGEIPPPGTMQCRCGW